MTSCMSITLLWVSSRVLWGQETSMDGGFPLQLDGVLMCCLHYDARNRVARIDVIGAIRWAWI